QSRCLCELGEGVQMCDDAGHLSACQCDDGFDAGAGLCPNGTVDPGEACDDGNAVSEDGCSTTCIPDGRPLGVEQCPGEDVNLWDEVTVNMSFVGFARGEAGDAGGDSGADAGATCGRMAQPDRRYRLVTTTNGSIEVTVASNESVSFSLRSSCADANSQLSC